MKNHLQFYQSPFQVCPTTHSLILRAVAFFVTKHVTWMLYSLSLCRLLYDECNLIWNEKQTLNTMEKRVKQSRRENITFDDDEELQFSSCRGKKAEREK